MSQLRVSVSYFQVCAKAYRILSPKHGFLVSSSTGDGDPNQKQGSHPHSLCRPRPLPSKVTRQSHCHRPVAVNRVQMTETSCLLQWKYPGQSTLERKPPQNKALDLLFMWQENCRKAPWLTSSEFCCGRMCSRYAQGCLPLDWKSAWKLKPLVLQAACYNKGLPLWHGLLVIKRPLWVCDMYGWSLDCGLDTFPGGGGMLWWMQRVEQVAGGVWVLETAFWKVLPCHTDARTQSCMSLWWKSVPDAACNSLLNSKQTVVITVWLSRWQKHKSNLKVP